MDLKIVIKQMLDKGLTREQVVSNLKELGVADADRLFDEATAGSKAQATPKQEPAPEEPKQQPQARGLFKDVSSSEEEKPGEEKQEPEQAQRKPVMKDDGEISLSELMETDGKGLFSKREKARQPEAESEEKKASAEEREEEEEPQEEKQETKSEPAKRVLLTAQLPADASLDDKIDEAIALLKALEAINEKILDTDRKVLLRLKD